LLLCQRPLTRLLSHRPRSTFVQRLAGNDIGDEGASALAAVLKETKITSLEYASTSNRTAKRSPLFQRLLTLVSHHPCPTHGSLTGNQLCGLDSFGSGTYTAEGITKLCEGLKGSSVTSLECAATP
jgi:hypothetical protein